MTQIQTKTSVRALIRSLYMALLAILTSAIPAMGAIGDLNYFPAFAPPVGDVARGDNMVYYVAAGNLFSYDTKEDETFVYSLADRLNDTDISSIYYNHREHYLAVCYSSGNIDLLYDGGTRTINVPDIAESNVAGSKKINDVAFAPGRMYMATDFGLVEYDTKRHEVVQSGIYNQPVQQVEVMDGHVVIFHQYLVMSIPQGERFNTIDKFATIHGSSMITQMIAIGPRAMLLRRTQSPTSYLFIYYYNDDMTSEASRKQIGTFTHGETIITAPDSAVYFPVDSMMYLLHADGNYEEAFKIPSDIAGNSLAIGDNSTDVWALNSEGITSYDLSGQSAAVTRARFLPASFPVTSVAYMLPSPKGDNIYAWNLGPTVFRAAGNGEGADTPQQTGLIDPDGDFTDISAREYEARNSWARDRQKALGVDRPIAPTTLVPHPTDPDTYYLGTGNDGILKVTSSRVIGYYDETNSIMSKAWGCRVFGLGFDPDGNLWASHLKAKDDTTVRALAMLPAAKVALPTDEVKASDWRAAGPISFSPGKDVDMLISSRSNMIYVHGQSADLGLLAINTKGTWDRVSDDTYHLWTTFVDQDGKSFTPERFSALCEDSRGRIWVGTDKGIIEISNPAQGTNPEMTVNRLKVPRNDGTNSADYLLDADLIYCIAEDHAGRKWIGTEASGLYLVSENGTEIIDHIDSDNSILPDNTIHSVCPSPSDNTLWIGTSYGLFSLESSASPARDDYSDVLVYPNPVRPDFTGDLTITGLMDGTLVKITDSVGNVVAQVRSEGGMAIWNCENQAGRRVPSGVYYVMLSSGSGASGESSSGAAAKFMIVN